MRNHIIHKLNVDINVPDIATARRIYRDTGELLNDMVLPRLEEKLQGLMTGEEYYRVDKITIDLQFDSETEFEKKLPVVAAAQLGKKLLDVKSATSEGGRGSLLSPGSKEALIKISETEKRWEIFLYFLETGRLPWYASSDIQWLDEGSLTLAIADIQSTDQELPGVTNTKGTRHFYKDSFDRVIRKTADAATRLARQFTSSFILSLVKQFYNYHPVWVDMHVAKVKKEFPDDQQLVQQLLVNVIVFFNGSNDLKKSNTDLLQSLADKFISDKKKQEGQLLDENNATIYPVPGAINDEQRKDLNDNKEGKLKKLIADDEEGIYVSHAGLVLLHSFLPGFFDELGLLDNKQFKNEQYRQKAIHLLYYLATGERNPYEYDLLMEKYLCGLPLDEPVERFVTLTKEEEEESEGLLKAIIEHWKVLKNTSPEGLREGFLYRNGKLVTGHDHRLLVESNSIDVLLEQLPWGYSIIRLSWMEKILYVDWVAQ